jgi:hypothetical protein
MLGDILGVFFSQTQQATLRASGCCASKIRRKEETFFHPSVSFPGEQCDQKVFANASKLVHIKIPQYRVLPVLPDVMFSNQKWQFLDCLAMKDFGTFYGHFVNFTAKLYILCPF